MLMAIVLPVAMKGVGVALNAADTARHTSEAATLGESKLNELVTNQLADGTSGDFGADWPAYKWTLQTTARDYSVSEVTLTVTWTGRDGERTLNISTMMLTTTAEGTQ